VHWLFGEGVFGVILVQQLLGVALMIVLVLITARLSGGRAWAYGAAAAVAFVTWKFRPIALDLLSESLYVPLLAGAALAAIHAAERPGPGSAAAAGVISGLAAITRSTSTLAWPVIILIEWLAWRRLPNRGVLAAILVGGMLTVLSLVGLRNWIVAGQFATASTGFGVTFYGGNTPPEGLALDLSGRAAFYQRFGVNEFTALVIEYALTAPGSFAANMGRKALFALGFYEPYAPGWGHSPVYILVWISALAGLVIGRRDHTAWLFFLPALIALSQYAAVVLIYPKGERLILPIHTVLLPYSAIAAHALVGRLRAAAAPRDVLKTANSSL
jgi:hypothetical protein